MLFDLIVEEMARCKPRDARRIRPVRVALQNQRDTLLAFAGVLDDKLAGIAQTHAIAEPLAREACLLHRLPTTSPAYWQGWNQLRATMSGKFHAVFDAVTRAMAQTHVQQLAGGEPGRSLRELMTGSGHPHWLTLLGLGPLHPQRA